MSLGNDSSGMSLDGMNSQEERQNEADGSAGELRRRRSCEMGVQVDLCAEDGERKVFYAPSGERYHLVEACQGLVSAKQVRLAALCDVCGKRWNAGMDLFVTEKAGHRCAHRSVECSGKTRKRLQPCRYCSTE